MKFVVLDSKVLPDLGGVRGPVLTPQEYDLHMVLRWLACEIDVREVMEDGSFRKLRFSDQRLMDAIDQKEIVKKQSVKVKEVVEPKKEQKPVIKEEPKPEPEVEDILIEEKEEVISSIAWVDPAVPEIPIADLVDELEELD